MKRAWHLPSDGTCDYEKVGDCRGLSMWPACFADLGIRAEATGVYSGADAEAAAVIQQAQ